MILCRVFCFKVRLIEGVEPGLGGVQADIIDNSDKASKRLESRSFDIILRYVFERDEDLSGIVR